MSVLSAIFEQSKTWLELITLRRKLAIAHRLGPFVHIPGPSQKVLITIVHIVNPMSENRAERLESLEASLSSIGCALAAHQVAVKLLSNTGMHLYDHLNPLLRKQVELTLCDVADPMYLGLQAFKLFEQLVENFDYFIFLEDDIVFHDSWMLEKIILFDQHVPNTHFLLQPHRYEWAFGNKYYLDQLALADISSKRYTIFPGTTIEMHGVRFCAFENPHAGIHILSKQKLRYWIKQGNPWGEQVSAFGPQESTATYHLMRSFTFLQPHPDNMAYLEVQHLGFKYFKQHIEAGKLQLPKERRVDYLNK